MKQGLYLSQQGCPDIHTAMSLLCGQLVQPDWDDYEKLTCLIQNLQETLYVALVLHMDESNCMHWWIDALIVIHPNVHGYTGATISMGGGSVFSSSWKQNLVTSSLTKSEIVGVYDTLPQVLWTKKFLEEQVIKETMVYQDNTSSILMEWNGK